VATQRKNRRANPERRSDADRRTQQAPVEVERRKGGERRSGLRRRLELVAVGDQIQAALDLVTHAREKGGLLEEDRWLLETAIARLQSALQQLDATTPP
jgi:hypothetical protein